MSSNHYALEQQKIADTLSTRYGFPREMVLFPNKRKPTAPWLAKDALLTIARKSEEIRSVSERFDKYIPDLGQVVHIGRVELQDGRVFEVTGVASLSEKLPDGSDEWDEHYLAASRALRSTLDAAGVNPMKNAAELPTGSSRDDTGPLLQPQPERHPPLSNSRRAQEASQEKKDLARIHILAEEIGLITRRPNFNDKPYRQFLFDFFRVDSALKLNAADRQSLINALEMKWNEVNL
jgi:hypothetical protein